ncbi:MAG: hypothetical protein RMK19_03970 [Bacteroidia bacterium]|nr:hypothetical protein [Bacteroidia bacterium]
MGLLSACGWDEDEEYIPTYTGTYIRVGDALYWRSSAGEVVRLSLAVRSIASTPWGLAALSADGQTLYLFEAGKLEPKQRFDLGEACSRVTAFFEKPTLCLACPKGIRLGRSSEKSFNPRWESLPQSGLFSHIATASSFIIAAGGGKVAVYEPQRFAQVAAASFSGTPVGLWIEHPTSAALSWRDETGTLRILSYFHPGRLFTYDSIGKYISRQTSPYLKPAIGTEYRGSISLMSDSVLLPGGHRHVSGFTADFLRGEVFFLRKDTVWRYQVTLPSSLGQVGIFSVSGEMEGVWVYRYGSAEVTIR